MRKTFFYIFFLIAVTASAQRTVIDSLKRELPGARDTNRVFLLAELSRQLLYSRPDSAIILAQEGYELSQKLHFPVGESLCLNRIANPTQVLGNIPKALQLFNKARTISEENKDTVGLGRTLNNIANLYGEQGEYVKAIGYLKTATQKKAYVQNSQLHQIMLENLGDCYSLSNQLDSATLYAQMAYAMSIQEKNLILRGDIERILGDIAFKNNNKSGALEYYQKSVVSSAISEDVQHMSQAYLSIAKFYQSGGNKDSVIVYARRALEHARAGGFTRDILLSAGMLSDLYASENKPADAFYYFKIATAAKDSLFSQEKVKQLQALSFEEKIKQQEIETATRQYNDRIKIYILLAGLVVLMLVSAFIIRNNRQKQKSYVLLQRQKAATDNEKEKAEQALAELKVTQAQLIQAEKMASLGELTAGIAHEIQNPLNFVNNFSEINKELIDELKGERRKVEGERNAAAEEELIKDIEENSEKINHHGKRADAIVKGMLQHSQKSSGQKVPTDINKLADEYLRLAYHGIRAKDNSFNATLKTDYDASIGHINIISQDIGRVLLNLYNNAFYAINGPPAPNGGGKAAARPVYEPTVWVSTKILGDRVLISVKDNGAGIPQNIADKIFQPFFTTKPTGQGTGLGLSLSYDIVKAHGGAISLESKEGEGSTFTILLPV